MAVFGNRRFRGQIPRVPARILPDENAARAEDCWLDQMQVAPIPELQPVAGVPAFDANVRSIWRFDANRWFQWPHDVDVVRAPVYNDASNRTIWTQGGSGTPQQTSTTIMQGGGFASPGLPISRRLGVPAPTHAPSVALGAAPDPADPNAQGESHAWLYTFVTDLGEEGPPSPPSVVLDRAFGADGSIQPVTLSDLATGPPAGWGASGITLKRIYRSAVGASGRTAYQLVAEIAIAANAHNEAVTTANLGGALISADWLPPESDLQGLIALTNGVLAAFKGREIFFSEPYQPHAWPSAYVQVAGSDIVGLDSFGTTVVVGTTGDPEVISGSDPAVAFGGKMEFSHACVSKHSFSYVDMQGVVYASPDGLVLVGPQGGSLISRAVYEREHWDAIGPRNIHAAYHDGYFMMFTIPTDGSAGRALAFDPEDRHIIEFPGDAAKAILHDRPRDAVYVVDRADNRLKQWAAFGEGTKREFTWESGKRIGPKRTFSSAQVIAEGYPVTLTLIHDGSETACPVEDGDPFRLPQMGIAAEWAFRIEGSARITEVRIGAAHEML